MNNEGDIMGAVRINITLPGETLDKLKKICKKEDRTRSNVLKRLIEAYSEPKPK